MGQSERKRRPKMFRKRTKSMQRCPISNFLAFFRFFRKKQVNQDAQTPEMQPNTLSDFREKS